jgi:type I site-specific restriction endonuclease
LYLLNTAADTSTITNAIVSAANGKIIDNYDFANAVAAGYLADSVEADVAFNDAANGLLYPTTAQIGGNDNGADYDDGLDVTTEFGSLTEDISIVTKQQGASWQIGAYIV